VVTPSCRRQAKCEAGAVVSTSRPRPNDAMNRLQRPPAPLDRSMVYSPNVGEGEVCGPRALTWSHCGASSTRCTEVRIRARLSGEQPSRVEVALA